MKRFLLLLALAIAGCATPPAGPALSSAQQAMNLTGTSCKNIDAAIVATDQAVLAGVLKGNAARDAAKGLAAAQAGCNVALASIQAATAAANPATTGAPK